jgi:hypothetical protein
MGNPVTILLITVLVLIGLLLACCLMCKRRNRAPDYYIFFIMGIVWMIVGILCMVLHDYMFGTIFVLGLIFSMFGLANKKKWKKDRLTWKKMSKDEKRMRIVTISALGVLVVLCLLLFFWARFLAN